MARGLDEILRELDASYNPQKQSINERIAALPAQADAEIEGLKGQQTQAFDDILSGARSRGLGFSGIPLGEQAKYTSSQFLPAVARVRTSQNENQRSLSDALNSINLDQNKYAQTLRQTELDREQQERQFQQQLRASQAAAAMPSFGGGTTGGAGAAAGSVAGVRSVQRGDKGFNFFDSAGNPISAAVYAQSKGQSFRTVLQEMANAGDAGARQALGFVGDDFGYDPGKVDADIYNALVWGTGRSAAAESPAAQPNIPLLRTNTPYLRNMGNA